MATTKKKPVKKSEKKKEVPTANSRTLHSDSPTIWIRIEYGHQSKTDVSISPSFPREKIEGFLMDIIKALK